MALRRRAVAAERYFQVSPFMGGGGGRQFNSVFSIVFFFIALSYSGWGGLIRSSGGLGVQAARLHWGLEVRS